MKFAHTVCRAILAISALSLAVATGHATASPILYTLTKTLTNFNAWDINEKGQIAGWGPQYAQIYTPGVGIITLPMVAGVHSSVAYTINESGQVAGRVYGLPNYDQSGRYVDNGFLYTPGGTPEVKTITGNIGFAYQLNENGQVVYLGGPLPPAPMPYGNDIITAVAGQYAAGYVGGPYEDYGHAWRRNSDNSFTYLQPYLSGTQSQAYGVNSSGTVVGRKIKYDNLTAFVYIEDLGGFDLFDVTDPSSRAGWTSFISAQDITVDGTIIGFGVFTPPNSYSGSLSSFVLTPIRSVPEPATLPLMAFSVGMIVWVRYRQKFIS